MKKNKQSITIKLWLAMTLLVLFVMFMTTVVQNKLLQRTYYQQQQNQLVTLGQSLAAAIVTKEDLISVNELLQNAASASSTSIILLDNRLRVITSQMVNNHHGPMHNRMGRMGMQRGNITIPDELATKLDAVLEGQTITARGESRWLNTEVLYVAVPVLENDQPQGIILIYAPVPDMATRLRALQGITIYTALGGLVLATLLSLVLSRSLVKPLLEMNNVAKAMAEGKYGTKAAVKSNDELGMLARSLNSLSAQLQDKIYNLERLNETRRDFVASISHELRTPLTIIQGYTEALQDGLAQNNRQRQNYLNYIHDEILRLRRLVDELLDLRRLESGQISINTASINIRPLLQQLLTGMEALAKERGVHISLQLPAGDVYINGDEDRLSQVLINLMDNALRVSKAGDHIKVQAQVRADLLEISITDSGPGIAKEDLPLIWERFYKVDKARTRAGHGTGLGLAISKKIIELHGGTIEVHSTPGQGSTFTVKLPQI